MKESFLKELHCPYCGSSFKLVSPLDICGEDIIHGIVQCNCRKYPLVAGILVLHALDLNALNEALDKLEKGLFKSALLRLFEPLTDASRVIRAAKYRGMPLSARIEAMREKLMQRYLHRLLCADSFSGTVDYFKFISFGGYFKYRFSSTSFIAGIPLILLMRYFAGPILEISCGMGHHGFVISQLYPDRRIALTDSSFVNLYLAKRFFVPQAEYVCLNANEPLPFADQSFNSVFSSDSLHYLYSKKLAIEEMARVSQGHNADIFLSHLHNLAGNDPVAGAPLTARGWLDLVSCRQVKLLPQTKVFQDFLAEDKLDLAYDFEERDIPPEGAFALAAASQPGFFRVHTDLGAPFFNLRNHLAVNPLYQLSFRDSEVLLRKKWPSQFIQAENITIDRVLPQELSLDKRFLERVISGKTLESDACHLSDLMKKFVLINVPVQY